MECATLANGVKMPMQGFGVFQVPPEDTERVVLDAVAAGYRAFDTAYTYGNEEALGSALRKAIADGTVTRDELFVATKAWITQMGEAGAEQAFRESLSRLGLSYLDLYLVHMPLGDYYGAWRAMERLYDEGLVRAIGVCNFDGARLIDLCRNVRIRPMLDQVERHPRFQRAEDLSVMAELGVQPQAWAPFSEGMHGMFENPVLADIAAKHGKTPAQVILRWDAQCGVATAAKTTHAERMAQNLGIWDFELDGADMEAISALDTGVPSMLDCSRPAEVRRLYGYLDDPQLTTLG